MPMRMYVFSNMILLVHAKMGVKEFMRIRIDKYSYVMTVPDFNYFKNRLYFYGVNGCVHLTFQSIELRNEIVAVIKKLVSEIN